MGLWTVEHAYTVLPAIAIYIVVSIFIARLLKGKSEKVRYIPFQIMATVILILEVIKQIYNIGENGYDLYALPFHYCSLFLYLLPLHSFYKGKYKDYVDTATFGTCSSLFFFMLVMPAIVYGEGAIRDFTNSFSSFHTVIFHNIVLFYFTLMVAMRMYKTNTKKDLKVLAVFLSIYLVIAITLSQTLQVNFHNLYKCNLGMVEDIRLMMINSIGWVGQAIYLAVLSVMTILFAYLAYFIVKGGLKLIDKLNKKQEN